MFGRFEGLVGLSVRSKAPWWLRLYVWLKMVLRRGRRLACAKAARLLKQIRCSVGSERLTPAELVRYLADNYDWVPDPLFGFIDVQKDLPAFLADKGGDCDDFALAVCRLLQAMGYKAYYVAAVSVMKPSKNHAFVVYIEDGKLYVATPYAVLPKWFVDVAEAVEEIGKMYEVKYDYWHVLDVDVLGCG